MSEIIIAGQTLPVAIAAAPGVTARVNSGATTAKRARVNFIEGTNITIGLVDDAGDGEVEVTIAATGAFPGYYAGAMSPDGSSSPGVSALVARGDHIHPISSVYRPVAYRMRSSSASFSAVGGTLSHAPVDGIAYTPRLALQLGTLPSRNMIGFATSASDEASFEDAGGSSLFWPSNFIRTSGDAWNLVTFNSTTVQVNHISGPSNYTGIFFVVGDA